MWAKVRQLFEFPRYDRVVILANSSAGKLWDHDVWNRALFPALDQLFGELNGKPSVHCRQLTRANSDPVKFGRIVWSRKSSDKWTHGSPLTRDTCSEWLFGELQLFSPERSELIRSGEMPDAFIQITRVGAEGARLKAIYDQALHIAIRCSSFSEKREGIDRILRLLAEAASGVATYRGRSRVSSLNQFESLLREDFYYRGMLEHELPVETLMKGKWSRV